MCLYSQTTICGNTISNLMFDLSLTQFPKSECHKRVDTFETARNTVIIYGHSASLRRSKTEITYASRNSMTLFVKLK